MTKIPLTLIAASLLTATIAIAQVAAPKPLDRTEPQTDKQEVARAISKLKPNREQLAALLDAHKAARAALKAKGKAAKRALALDYEAQMEALEKAQADEKQAMLAKMP